MDDDDDDGGEKKERTEQGQCIYVVCSKSNLK
jgi:hypothetical protein